MAVPSACSKLKNLSSAFPDRPSTPSGRASTHRQRSGIGCRATSGLSQPPLSTPASTTRPGAAKVQAPTLERSPRPVARASSIGPAEMPASSATPRAIARPSFVPEPSPACGGIASRTSTSTPPPVPERLTRPRRERGSAVAPATPAATTSSPGVSPHRNDHPRGLDADADASEPPRADPGRIEHSEVQPRRRGDHDLGHVRSATYRRT